MDNGAGDFFGRYLSIQNNTILIGAHQDDENGYASGSLYAFFHSSQTSSFSETQKILPNDGGIEEFFGYSIDIEGSWAITGSHHDSDFGGSSGSAFLLKHNSDQWDISMKLLPGDPRAGDEFGKAVALDNNYLAIGAFLDDDQNTNGGSVYIFENVEGTWSEKEEIYPNDQEAYDQFGNFLVFNDSLLAVGVPEKRDHGDKSGCTYIFKLEDSAFEQSEKITPDDLKVGDHFGQALDIMSDRLVIGAYKADSPLEDGGAAYVYIYEDEKWILHQKIVPDDNEEGDHFGNSISMMDEWLAIGAYFDDDNGSKSGSVYLYKYRENIYQLSMKINASDGSFGDAFGASVDLDSIFLLVGAYADSDNGFFSGSAYVYDLSSLLLSDKLPEKEISIKLYPSIVDDQLNIIGDFKHSDPALLHILDQNGNIVGETILNESKNSLSIGNLKAGCYFVRISSKEFQQIHKIVKIHH